MRLRAAAAMGKMRVLLAGRSAGCPSTPNPAPGVCLLTRVVAFHARRHAVSSRPGDPPVEALHSLWELGKKRE